MSRSLDFTVTGLSCASCVGRVERALSRLEGTETVHVNPANGAVRMTGRDTVDVDAAIRTLDDLGYPALVSEHVLTLDGMHCASCVSRVERALVGIPGVLSAEVLLPTQTARVRVLQGAVSPSALVEAVRESGYEASVVQGEDAPDAGARQRQEADNLRSKAILAAVLTLPVVILEMGGHLFPPFHHLIGQTIGHQTSWILQWALTTAVLFGPGREFFRLGFTSLRHRAPDMNALVALGAGAAWLYSTLVLIRPGLFPEGAQAVYFEAAAVIVTLILLGRSLEARAKGRSGDAIRRLLRLSPDTGFVERDGQVIERPVAEIVPDDLLHLRPGGRVPVDGVVVSGQTFIDESMLTGEPIPVAKGAGDPVSAGTVNGTGALQFRATAVGADTMLSGIVALVERAQGTRLPVQDVVNRITAVFVPVVLAIAALTVVIWLAAGPEPRLSHALVAGVSVLIIACPCAMGLATPMSIMVGIGRAAELGVLFRKGDALQRLETVDVVAFDKTGTLTQGRPELIEVRSVTGDEGDELLRLAASVEAMSEHPIATAILRGAEVRDTQPVRAEDVTATPGQGAAGRVDEKDVVIGTATFLQKNGIDTSALDGFAADRAELGETPVFVGTDERLLGVLTVADPVRPEAKDTISALHAQGIRTAMISGDRSATAWAIAREIGIDDVTAEVLPDGKVAVVEALRRRHGSVAFVGDGINDAPALAAADVGIAAGSGTDIAIETADVVLAGGHIGGVARAIGISRATMRNLRQNLFWAFAYNAALIPVAAGILYPVNGLLLSPMLAAGAMSLSSVFVVTNALRLRHALGGPGPAGKVSKSGALSPAPAE